MPSRLFGVALFVFWQKYFQKNLSLLLRIQQIPLSLPYQITHQKQFLMFLVKLYDRNRQELSIGDIVAVSDGKHIKFYCRITFLEKEQKIAPFHTFSFHSVEKVDKVPENATPCTEDRYECWYMGSEAKPDESAALHDKYLLDWRACERFLDKSCFDVVPVSTPA